MYIWRDAGECPNRGLPQLKAYDGDTEVGRAVLHGPNWRIWRGDVYRGEISLDLENEATALLSAA
jgi:hypothetical protein